MYPFPTKNPVTPASDGAGNIIAVGKNVQVFSVGDKVCTLFNQEHQYNPIDKAGIESGLGGARDGTLRQYAAFPEHGVVLAPSNLTPIEASTLPCAPLTAWNGLYGLQSKALKAGDWVLTQGTGGVSLSGIQFAKAAGAIVIATTSSDDKAKKLKDLGADYVINYKTTENWGEVAKGLTPGKVGVDHILEVGGPGTMKQSLNAIKMEGVIAIIGFLGGAAAEDQPSMLDALNYVATIRGLLVGSRQQFVDMNRAIDANNIHPVVDKKVFEFEQVPEAMQYQWDQKHFGKVVVKVGGRLE